MRLRPALLACAALAAALGAAQAPPPVGTQGTDVSSGMTNAQIMRQMGITQNLGVRVPLDARFTDSSGKEVRLGDLIGKRPVLIMPMFFLCQGSCGRQVDQMLKSIVKLDTYTVNRDYDVILLSINPKETPELTAGKKNTLLGIYDRPGSFEGFHFLTGDIENIRKVTNALGFRWVYLPERDQIYHPAGAMVITPDGRVAQYFYGIEFPTLVLSRAIAQAKENEIGQPAEMMLFGCLAVDPATGQRRLVIQNVVRVAGGLTLIVLATWIGMMSVRYRRSPNPDDDEIAGGGNPA